MNDLDEKIAKLPKWVGEYICSLRERLAIAREPLLQEMVKLRPQVALLKARNEALTELLDCAARGGHKTAFEIMEIIRAYDLTLTPHAEDK